MKPILDARNLEKTFNPEDKPVRAVQDVSLHIDAGEILAFLGPNGAGKTTTIKIIAGLVKPDSGTVSIDGWDPHRDARALREVGAVLEGNRNTYWRFTPQENLEYFGVLRGLSRTQARARVDDLLERFGLTEKRNTIVQQLSRGMQQKLAIAVALIHRPKLLLLDEPTLGLDVEAAESVKHLVREIAQEGHSVLLTTHQLDVAEQISDRVAIIRHGEIIAEEPTMDLIERFSGQSYMIEAIGELSDSQRQKLEALGAKVDSGTISYLGSPDGLWQVLDAVRPLPIIRIERDQADLTGVFLKLVRESKDA